MGETSRASERTRHGRSKTAIEAGNGDVKQVRVCGGTIFALTLVTINDALSKKQKAIALAQVTHRSLSEVIIFVDLIDIKVTLLALFELTTACGNQMRFKISALTALVCLAIWENAVLDQNIRAILHKVSLPFAQRIRYIAHMAIYHDTV